MRTTAEILHYFEAKGFAGEHSAYLKFHLRRYVRLLETLDSLLAERAQRPHGPLQLLDVGISYQTVLFHEALPGVCVSTLGFNDSRFAPLVSGPHYPLDLNDVSRSLASPMPTPPDVIVMAEVLEHLHTASTLVLGCLGGWLAPGGWLILQTPNGISLGRRLQMLAGRYPLEMIREDRNNPGHFREYTRSELLECGREAGLEVVAATLENYFGEKSPRRLLYNAVCKLAPFEWEEGIMVVYRKPAA